MEAQIAQMYGIPNLNTSHVILYQIVFLRLHIAVSIFKYISCYSLSGSDLNGLTSSKQFKYISCYSLSLAFSMVMVLLCNLNTSHVILYH